MTDNYFAKLNEINRNIQNDIQSNANSISQKELDEYANTFNEIYIVYRSILDNLGHMDEIVDEIEDLPGIENYYLTNNMLKGLQFLSDNGPDFKKYLSQEIINYDKSSINSNFRQGFMFEHDVVNILNIMYGDESATHTGANTLSPSTIEHIVLPAAEKSIDDFINELFNTQLQNNGTYQISKGRKKLEIKKKQSKLINLKNHKELTPKEIIQLFNNDFDITLQAATVKNDVECNIDIEATSICQFDNIMQNSKTKYLNLATFLQQSGLSLKNYTIDGDTNITLDETQAERIYNYILSHYDIDYSIINIVKFLHFIDKLTKEGNGEVNMSDAQIRTFYGITAVGQKQGQELKYFMLRDKNTNKIFILSVWDMASKILKPNNLLYVANELYADRIKIYAKMNIQNHQQLMLKEFTAGEST